jgi:hypothetical protein
MAPRLLAPVASIFSNFDFKLKIIVKEFESPVSEILGLRFSSHPKVRGAAATLGKVRRF